MGIAILRFENWTFQTRRRTAVRICTCTRRKTSDTVKTVRANVALLAHKQTLGNEVISGGSFVFLHIVNISQAVQDSQMLKKSILSPKCRQLTVQDVIEDLSIQLQEPQMLQINTCLTELLFFMQINLHFIWQNENLTRNLDKSLSAQ